MIGNDVVDLELAKKQSSWERKGFLERVFTPSERISIGTAGDLHLRVWLLWSMKEAAYKAHQRLFNLPRKLNWQEQRCEIFSFEPTIASGVVRIGTETYFTHSTIKKKAVLSSAVYQKEVPVRTRFFEGSASDMKTLFLREFSKEFTLNINDLSLTKNKEGIPLLLYQNEYLNTAFSFTGHGSFAAFSFPLTNC